MTTEKLTGKQLRFCEEYLKDFNATKSAINAGYSKKTAYSIGCENLKKPEIKKYIETRLSEMSLGEKETVKLISDIAKSNLNDYLVTRKVERVSKIEKGLSKLIKELEERIRFEDEYMAAASLSDEHRETILQMQENWRNEIIRYRIELKRNPKAKRIVDGPAELVDVVELDMVALSRDKERGRIKSIEHKQFGVKVELYGADGALRDIGKMHGIFEKDNKQRRDNIYVGYEKIDED